MKGWIEIGVCVPVRFLAVAARFGFTASVLASLLSRDFCDADPSSLWIVSDDPQLLDHLGAAESEARELL